MITLEIFWMGRDKLYPPTPEQYASAVDLLNKITQLEQSLGLEFIMTGGYRPETLIESHALPGCAHDAHSKAQGIDLHDPDLSISRSLVADPSPLVDIGLWMESPISARDHLHLQSYGPRSGHRVFLA